MRILLVNDRIPPENRGGAGEIVWRLGLGLRDAGHEVHIAVATSEASFTEIREGIPTYHFHSNYPVRWHAWFTLYNPQTAGPLRRLYRQIQPDLVNGHNIHSGPGYYSLQIARNMGIPAVFTSHDVMPFAYHKLSQFIDPNRCGVETPDQYRLPRLFNLRQMRFRYNPLRNIVIRQILKRATRVRTAPSQALCDAHAANGLPAFTCVHNGIDVDSFKTSDSAVKALADRLNLHGRKVILFAGRLTGAKGTNQLLDAFKGVVKSVPEALLLVLSSVPIEEQIAQPQYKHLRENHMLSGGWLSGETLVAAFHLARMVVVPSIIFDTFPTVNLEAMAAAKPVLATCYGGSHEVVVDGETGYLINPFDTKDFTHKMTILLQDDELCQRMGSAGYERVTTHFTMQQHVAKMLEVYRQASGQY